jgi:CrcB protein
MIALWIALAGGLGAGARLIVDGAISSRWANTFPVGTFVINIGGSLLLGIVAGLVLFHGAPHAVQLVVGTGFCGGYTTFSTASIEIVRLARRRLIGQALSYAVGSVVLTTLAAAAGLGLAAL